MDLGRLSAIEIAPINRGAEFRFRLRSSDSRLAAEFVVSAGDMTKLTHALQVLHARQRPRPSGKPSLRVVTDE